jgi:hypothetical protein
MTTKPFSDWAAEVSASQIAVSETDIVSEARANMWSFSLSRAQAAIASAEVVRDFILQVAEILRTHLQTRAFRPASMVFYSWVDQQAAQLRCCVVSAAHGKLPFECRLAIIEDPIQLARAFLGASYHDGIPLSELRDFEPHTTTQEDNGSQEEFILDVWTRAIP